MFKKIISIILALTFIPVFAIADETADTNILVNEVFNDYPTYGEAEAVIIKSGNSASVVKRAEGDKALYGKTAGSRVKFTVPTGESYDKMVFSYDIKLSGDFTVGSALSLKSGSSEMAMFNYNADGSITLEDGMQISGYKDGRWHNYTVLIDYSRKCYDLYRDNQLLFKNHYFSQTAVQPKKEIEFSFGYVNADDVTEIWLDNVFVYEGNTLPKDMNLPKKAFNSKVLTADSSAQDQKVYETIFLDTNSRVGFDKVNFTTSKIGNTGDWKSLTEGGNPYIHFTKESSNDMFGTITLPNLYDDIDSYVYQIDIYPVANPSATINAGTINAVGGGYSQILKIDKNKNICVGDQIICPIEYGKWTTVTVAVDLKIEQAKVYVNGTLKAEELELPDGGAIQPDNIRLGFSSGTPAEDFNEVYFNRLKMYDGNVIREFEDVEITGDVSGDDFQILQAMKKTTVETSADAIKLLADDVAFNATSGKFYAKGKKYSYKDYGADAYMAPDGDLMVDSKVVAFAIDKEALVEASSVTIGGKAYAAEIKNDVSYVNLKSVLKDNFSYVYDTDNRGFIVASHKDRGYVNYTTANDNKDDIDKIWRYLHFDRPDGDELYEALVNGGQYKSHPRLLVTKDEIPALRAKVENSPELKEVLVNLLKKCDGYIKGKPVEYKLVTIRLLSACHAVRDRLFDLTTAYILTGDEKYAECGWREMENALSWNDWNIKQHYLDTGGISPGIALGYDVFYDYLSEEQREFVRENYVRLMLDYAVGVYTGHSNYKALSINHSENNWGAVIGAGMFMTAFAFMDDLEPDSPFTQKCKYLAENALRTFEYLLTISTPEGSWWEGIGYYEYFMQSYAWTMQSLLHATGSTYNLMTPLGINKLPLHAFDLQTNIGSFNRDSQTGIPIQFAPETMLLSRMYGDEEMEALCNSFNSYVGEKDYPSRYLLFADPSKQVPGGKITLPVDRVYTDTGIAVLRGAWNDTKTAYVGICAGITEEKYGINTHFDKGSFIFENDSERWIVDMGRDSSSPFPFCRRAEIHSVPVIDPTADYTGQKWGGVGVFPVSYESKPRGFKIIYDMAPVYEGQVEEFRRGFLFSDNRNTLIVQDEMTLSKESDIEWNLITKANIEISSDKKSATFKQNGKEMKLDVYCNAPDWHLEERSCTPLTGISTDEEKAFVNTARKLVLVTKTGGELIVSAKMSPKIEGEVYAPFSYIPMDSWTIPEGEMPPKAELTGIYADGKLIDGFASGVRDYTMVLPYGSAMPVFTASGNVGTIEVKQPALFTENAEIIVHMPDGRMGIYRISFKITEKITDILMMSTPSVGKPGDVELLAIKGTYVSDEPQPQNPGTGATDGDLNTRWSTTMKGAYLEVDLGEVKDIAGIAMAFMSGTERQYIYDILISDDKMNYQRVYTGNSTGATNDWEYLKLPVKARYVRYVAGGYKNGPETQWNSIVEMRPAFSK